MSIILGIFFFFLGTAIGSFLNVVILRYNTGLGIAEGRSQCFSCGKTLEWYELIPVFSFLFLKGRCSRCQSRISWQYPLIECITGLSFLAIFLKYENLFALSPQTFFVTMLYSLIVVSILIVILVYDIHHKIIPDGLVFILALLAFGRLFFALDPVLTRGSLLHFLAGPILALPFALLWLVSKGKWMGLGDAKLILPLGWLLGLAGGISGIILAFWIGALASVTLIVIQKSNLSFKGSHLTMKSEIPFAPFLIIGFALVFFFNIQVIDLSALVSLF
jgi:prepilin signal peptidase PulO-like enzyme (type II secretory pathway)